MCVADFIFEGAAGVVSPLDLIQMPIDGRSGLIAAHP